MEYPLRQSTRAADDSIRGYLYQLIWALRAWVSLGPNEVLVCEGNEDIDRLLLDELGNFVGAREEQIKAEAVAPSGLAALTTIRAFMLAFREHRDAGRACRFAFTSTANLPETDRGRGVREALRRWRGLKEVKEEEKQAEVREIAKDLVVQLEAKAAELDGKAGGTLGSATTADLIQYISDNDLWGPFLESVTWTFDALSLADLRDAAVAELVAHGTLPLPADLVLSSLLHRLISGASAGTTSCRMFDKAKLDIALAQDGEVMRAWIRTHNVTRLADYLSPFQSAEAFFLPLTDRENPFGHWAPLVGLADECERLATFAREDRADVFILTAPPGHGKSRLLYHVAQQLAASADPVAIVFVDARAEEMLPTTMMDVPAGRCVLVLEDAEPGVGLGLTIKVREAHKERVRVIVACWPTRVEGVRAELLRAGVSSGRIEMHKLRQITGAEARQLARESLGKSHAGLAENLAAMLKSSPFAIVVGGRLIAQGRVAASELQSSDEFQAIVVRQLVLAAEEARKRVEDQVGVRLAAVFDLLAMVGRIRGQTHPMHATAATHLQLRPDQLTRALDELARAGFVVRRGRTWELFPEFLSRAYALRACMSGGETTGYGELVFSEFRDHAAGAVLLRIAEVANETRPGGKNPFENLWASLAREIEEGDAQTQVRLLEMLESIGFWQPDAMLRLTHGVAEAAARLPTPAKNWLPSAHNVREAIANALRSVSYHLDRLPAVLRQLVELRQHNNAEKVVEKLASYALGKPLEVHNVILDFVENELKKCATAKTATPLFELVKPHLARVGEYHRMEKHTWTSGYFPISCSSTREIRRRCRSLVAQHLDAHGDSATVDAVAILRAAISPTLPSFQSVADDAECWSSEELEWFGLLEDRFSRTGRSTHLLLADAIQWCAEHGSGKTREVAASHLNRLLAMSEVRELAAVAGKYELYVLHDEGHVQWQLALDKFFDDAARVFLGGHPSPSDGHVELLTMHDETARAGLNFSPESFIEKLAVADTAYALRLAKRIVEAGPGPLTFLLGKLMHGAAIANSAECAPLLVEVLSSSDASEIRALIAGLVTRRMVDNAPDIADLVIAAARRANDSATLCVLVRALRHAARGKNATVLETVFGLDASGDSKLIEEIARVFEPTFGVRVEGLSALELDRLYLQLESAPRLDGHWTETLLSELASRDSGRVLSLLIRRITTRRNLGPAIHPVPLAESHALDLHIAESELPAVLDRVFAGLAEDSDSGFWWSRLFWLVADPAEAGQEYLKSLAGQGLSGQLPLFAQLIEHGPSGWLRQMPEFVNQLLSHSLAVGGIASLEMMRGAIYSNAVPREWSGALDAPPPAFVTAKAEAESALRALDPTSHAYSLFSELKREVETKIADHLASGEEDEA